MTTLTDGIERTLREHALLSSRLTGKPNQCWCGFLTSDETSWAAHVAEQVAALLPETEWSVACQRDHGEGGYCPWKSPRPRLTERVARALAARDVDTLVVRRWCSKWAEVRQ